MCCNPIQISGLEHKKFDYSMALMLLQVFTFDKSELKVITTLQSSLPIKIGLKCRLALQLTL
jgi:hypothetical protein